MDPVPLLMPVIYAIILPIPLIFTPSSLSHIYASSIFHQFPSYMFMISYIIIYHIPIFHHLPSSSIIFHPPKKMSPGQPKSPPAAKPRRNAPRQLQQLGVAQALRALRGRRRRRASARAARAPTPCAPGPPSTSLAPWGLEPRGLGHWDGAWVHGGLMESDFR